MEMRSQTELLEQIATLQLRLEEAESTINAIRDGEVDAVVMRDLGGERVYTLAGADQPYRLLIEAMHQGAATLGADGTILYCNRSFASIMQKPQEKLIGSSASSLFLTDSDVVLKVLAEGSESTELHIAQDDGTPLLVSASVGILQLQDSTASFLILRDLTEHKQHEELKETDRRKDEFLAMLAHELRNPLAPISSAIAMLSLANKDENATVKLVCDIVQRQTHQLTRIVDDLLDVSRITRGVVVLKREPQDICAVVAEAVETSQPLFAAQNHVLHLTLPEEELYINGDSARLSQVLTNLLNNAAKYTEPGGEITVVVKRDQDDVRISVRDSGVGIPASMLSAVFDIFAQLERSIDRSQGGLGIGLTVARSLVSLHGGRIEAHSAGPGTGSEFVIHLPLLPHIPPGKEQVKSKSLDKICRRVLIVDDNRDAANIMRMLLQNSGQNALAVYDGRAAIAAVEEFQPELVLLDIGLPGMDGFEVAQHIRKKYTDRHIVLAALTGYGDDEDRRRSREAGFDFHYVKPIEFATLIDVLERVNSVSANSAPNHPASTSTR